MLIKENGPGAANARAGDLHSPADHRQHTPSTSNRQQRRAIQAQDRRVKIRTVGGQVRVSVEPIPAVRSDQMGPNRVFAAIAAARGYALQLQIAFGWPIDDETVPAGRGDPFRAIGAPKVYVDLVNGLWRVRIHPAPWGARGDSVKEFVRFDRASGHAADMAMKHANGSPLSIVIGGSDV